MSALLVISVLYDCMKSSSLTSYSAIVLCWNSTACYSRGWISNSTPCQFEPANTKFPVAPYCHHLFDKPKKLYYSISDCLLPLVRNMVRAQDWVWYMVYQHMIWWLCAEFLWGNQHGLTEVVPLGDLVLLADRLRGSRPEIWMSSWVVVHHITLINHLNALFSGPLAWTNAQNKEIESHLNQGCRAELTWNESYRLHCQWIPIRPRRWFVKRNGRNFFRFRKNK